MAQGNQPQRRNLAAEAFKRHYTALRDALAQPDVASGLAIKLYSGAIIALETRDVVQTPSCTPTQQADLLLQAVESSVKIDHTRLRKFTRVLKKQPALEPIAKQLRRCYCELVSEARLIASSSSGSDTDSTSAERHQSRGQDIPQNSGTGSEDNGEASKTMQKGHNGADTQLQQICGNFANSKCADTDLLVVCDKIVSHDYSAAEVSACLSLEESVARVMSDYEHSPRFDVIHQLLIKWKVSKEKDVGDTWASLVQSLASLSNSERLLEVIGKYLHQKDPCRPEAVGVYSRNMIADEETFSPTAPSFISSPPLSESTSPSYQLEWSLPPLPVAQATPPQDRITYVSLVTGRSAIQLQPAPAMRESRVNVMVKEKMRAQEEEFAHLLAFASDRLQALPGVTPDMLRVYVNQLSVSKKERVPQFSEHMAGIISVSNYSQIFTFLTRVGAWGFLNFDLLKRIANRYGDDDMKRKVEAYGIEVNVFKSETKFKDYLRIWSGRSEYGSLPERKPLIVKLEEKWEHYTLADVAEEEGYLAAEFLLEPYIFHFSNAGEGSVILMWLIPASAVPLIKRALMETGMKCAPNICELIVDDQRFIFKMCLTRTPTCAQPQMIEQQTEHDMNADYTTTYEESIQNPEKFWGELAGKYLLWEKPFEKVMDCKMEEGKIQWFTGGKLNVSVNCLDRHVKTHPERTALIWEKDEPEPDEKVTYSYRELLDMTCRIANVLKKNKIKKGDTVVIYMPITPLTVASMLACSRIGAIHSVFFTAFDAEALKKMINNAHAKAVITVNQQSLKGSVDQAVDGTEVMVFVASNSKAPLGSRHERDIPLEKAMEEESTECTPELMDSEDKFFIIYTSGTSDEPRGIVHTQAGYLLYAAVTHKHVFNYKPGEVFACVAGLCWITGHSYVVYGPLCNGGTTVLFDRPSSPDCDRCLEMISRLKVNHFYTSPATIRLLMKAGENCVKKHDLSSLKTIGSVGEPLSAGAWTWYNKFIGKENCTLVDTWWQTEIGGIAITPHPAPSGSRPKPGFTMKPFYGVEPVIVDDKGKILEGPDVTGFLCLKKPLPGMGRCINGDPQKYKEDYFQHFPAADTCVYFTNDVAYRDADGDYKIIVRKNDIPTGPINEDWISIYRDLPETENAVNMSDPRVLEASVVPYQENDSETIEYKVFIQFIEEKEEVSKEEKRQVIEVIEETLNQIRSSYTVPRRRYIVVKKQPKTHSGKINRHVLKFMASIHEGWQPCAQQLQQNQDNTTSRSHDDQLKTIDVVGVPSHAGYALNLGN